MTDDLTDGLRDYLVALARGDRSIAPWRSWCDDNREALDTIHGRAGLLRLKFAPSEHVPPWLATLGIECGPVCRKQLAKAARGAGWEPLPDPYGLRALYAAGRRDAADKKCRRIVRDLVERETDETEGYLGVGLADLCVDAEGLFEDGFLEEAQGLARALAALDATDAHLAPYVTHAEEILARITEQLRPGAGRGQ